MSVDRENQRKCYEKTEGHPYVDLPELNIGLCDVACDQILKEFCVIQLFDHWLSSILRRSLHFSSKIRKPSSNFDHASFEDYEEKNGPTSRICIIFLQWFLQYFIRPDRPFLPSNVKAENKPNLRPNKNERGRNKATGPPQIPHKNCQFSMECHFFLALPHLRPYTNETTKGGKMLFGISIVSLFLREGSVCTNSGRICDGSFLMKMLG